MQRFTEKELFGYECSLNTPYYTADDLQLFKSIINFFEKEADLDRARFDNINDLSRREANRRILEQVSGKDVLITREQIKTGLAEYLVKNNPPYIRAFNGVLNFLLTPVFLAAVLKTTFLVDELVPALLQYIWQPKLVAVNNTTYYIKVKNGESIIKDCAFTASVWNNETAQQVAVRDYLLFEVNGKWLAVKPKIWLPVLHAQLQQYDAAGKRTILEVVDESLFESLKNQFANNASNLSFMFTEVNGRLEWTGTIMPPT